MPALAALAALLLSAARIVGAATVADTCAVDLDAIPDFLLENDTGANAEWAQWGQAHFDTALAHAREDVRKATDEKACSEVLNAYLKAWRRGHLAVIDKPRAVTPQTDGGTTADAPESSSEPWLTLLSRRTLLLTIPSFEAAFRAPLVALLAKQRSALLSHANWIIDVRENDGGDDSTYAPLLPWLLPDEHEEVQAEWLATPANIEGQEKVCALFSPGDKNCEQFVADAVKRMRGVPSGNYVSQEDGPDMQYLRVEKLEPHRPARVAVLVDRRCGSSCEEFLLAVRQSFNVKLVGRRSYGSLDYSNVRPHELPSGERLLLYATSRSKRLPDLPIDVAGVQPDIYLPRPTSDAAREAEVFSVQRWLEGGSLAPVH